MELNESQEAKVSRSGGSPLRRRMIIGLVIVAIILCAVVVLWMSQKKKITCAKRLEDGTCNVANLYDHNYDTITYVPLTRGKQILVSTTFDTHRIDYDCTEGRFYAISYEANQISSAYCNCTDQKRFIEEDTIDPVSLAVDWISRRLYWADWLKGTLEVASLENPTVRTLLIYKNLHSRLIAVDPLRSKLYWVNTFQGVTIEWSNLDGTERQELVSSPQISDVRSIKVSTSTGELCYIDRGQSAVTGRIECIDPSNKQIRTIASNLTEPDGLAITDELFYWIDWNSDTIESINSNGVRQEPIAVPSDASGITAVTGKCPLLYSPCARNNGDCPGNTICLVNSDAPGAKSCIMKKKCEKDYACYKVIEDI